MFIPFWRGKLKLLRKNRTRPTKTQSPRLGRKTPRLRIPLRLAETKASPERLDREPERRMAKRLLTPSAGDLPQKRTSPRWKSCRRPISDEAAGETDTELAQRAPELRRAVLAPQARLLPGSSEPAQGPLDPLLGHGDHEVFFYSERSRLECMANGGCCEFDCGCCRRPLDTTRDTRTGHCTMECGCCIRQRGFYKPSSSSGKGKNGEWLG